MRKSMVPLAIAIVATTTFPVYAGKYTCTFQNGGSPLRLCEIESGTDNWWCNQRYSASLWGECTARKGDGGGDQLKCEFDNPNDAERTRGPDKTDAKINTEKSGLFAGGLTAGAPAGLVLTVAYRESAAAPAAQVVCTPIIQSGR
jgi:hypothetical protein